VPADSLT